MYACMNTSSSEFSCCIFNIPMKCSLDIDINICPHIRVHECFRSKKKIYDMPNWKNLSVCDMYGSRSTVKLPPEEFTVIMLLPYIVMYGHSSPYCYVVVLAINACALREYVSEKALQNDRSLNVFFCVVSVVCYFIKMDVSMCFHKKNNIIICRDL